jgi:hypothetical protein
MISLELSLVAALERIAKLRAIASSEPEFANWLACEGLPPGLNLIQLHREGPITDPESGRQSALKIAKAFGGKWVEEKGGSWAGNITDGNTILGSSFQVILHGAAIPEKGHEIEIPF